MPSYKARLAWLLPVAVMVGLACQSNPQDNPFLVQCALTEIGAIEPIVVVLGQDQVPTGFDSINIANCTFNQPVESITIDITEAVGSGPRRAIRSDTIEIAVPATEIRFPLTGDLATSIMPTGVAPGNYSRFMQAVAVDGQRLVLPQVARGEPTTTVYLVEDQDGVFAQLVRARARWELRGLPDYRYQFRWDCACPPELTALVNVEVRSGSITDVSFTADANLPGKPKPDDYRTIDGLLAMIVEAIDQSAFKITATFDSERGYPTEAFIDFYVEKVFAGDQRRVADEERGWVASDVVAIQ